MDMIRLCGGTVSRLSLTDLGQKAPNFASDDHRGRAKRTLRAGACQFPPASWQGFA